MTSDAKSMSPTAILAEASTLRRDGATPKFSGDAHDNPICLGNSHIYRLEFPDESVWAFRLPFRNMTVSGLPPEIISSLVEQELGLLTELSEAGFRWAPRLIGGDNGFANPVGHPYIVHVWTPGSALEWTDTIPDQTRERFLRQLTNIQLDLIASTKRPAMQSSTLKYLQACVDDQIDRILAGRLSELDTRNCLIHRSLLRITVNDAAEPSTIVHGNLAAHKIIVDTDLNITGIIDWKLAKRYPISVGLQHPQFLAVPRPEDPPSAGHHEGASDTMALPPSARLLGDREMVTSHLKTRVLSEKPDGPAEQLLSSLTDPKADWKDVIIQACFSKGLASWLAARGWLLTDLPSDEALGREADEYLETKEKETNTTRDDLLKP